MINNLVDKIFCVNLTKRVDRLEQSKKEFSRFGLNVDFFAAIDGKKLESKNNKINSGHMGCCMSHREIYKTMKKEKWNNILILEDDVEFHSDLLVLFKQFYTEVPADWNLLYFGGNHNRVNKNMISDHVHKLVKTYTTHCYMVNSKALPSLLEEFDDDRIFQQEVDVHLSNVQNKIPCYGFYPHLAWQRESFSDIELKNTNYTFLRG